MEAEYEKRQETLTILKEQLAELEKTHTQLNEETENTRKAPLEGKEERDKLSWQLHVIFAAAQMRCQGRVWVRAVYLHSSDISQSSIFFRLTLRKDKYKFHPNR